MFNPLLHPSPPMHFGVVGIDHRHIYDQVQGLLDTGAECAGYWSDGAAVTEAGFVKRFPDIPRVADRRALLDDARIELIVCAAVPHTRAAHAVEAMQRGKGFMTDKPGVTTVNQLAHVRQVQADTGCLYSINFSERFEVRAMSTATELVRAGAIGTVIHTTGLGPHRLNRATRPAWFFERAAYGGILVDIGSHQIDQFLHFAGATDARIDMARCGNLHHPELPGLQDFGELMLHSGKASGYARLDWFTPDGLATWGDARLVILGTDGYLELRKYIDIAGRPGKDHLFLVNHEGTRHIDCSGAALTYYTDLRRDLAEHTESAMRHQHCFKVCELALAAQAMAEAQGKA